MPRLLILGSKPSPALPRRGAFAAVACANASVASAARYGLPAPTFTAISAHMGSRKKVTRLQVRAMSGLETDSLIYIPARRRGGSLLDRLERRILEWRLTPENLRADLDAVSFRYSRFVHHDEAYYWELTRKHAHGDEALIRQLSEKSPSTGVLTLLLGFADGRFDGFILAGFSFERSQAWTEWRPPGVAIEGPSRHLGSDVAMLRQIARFHPEVRTTEPVVAEATGIPLLDDALLSPAA